MSLDSFSGTLRRGDLRKNASKYHLGKMKHGGYLLTDCETGKTWEAPAATKYIENCRFHYETIANMIDRDQVFIIDVIWKNEVTLRQIGDLMNCKLLVGAWWCTEEKDPCFLVDQIDLDNKLPLNDFRNECPICKYRWGRRELLRGFGCGHYYHMCCFNNKWFQKFDKCPICSLELG
jgi:hypothetical protein